MYGHSRAFSYGTHGPPYYDISGESLEIVTKTVESSAYLNKYPSISRSFKNMLKSGVKRYGPLTLPCCSLVNNCCYARSARSARSAAIISSSRCIQFNSPYSQLFFFSLLPSSPPPFLPPPNLLPILFLPAPPPSSCL